MNLSVFPRRRYTKKKTDLQRLEHLSAFLGGPMIYAKRDDCLGLTAGGNKTRKLEFLVADALNNGCDTLITCGAIQSNHCRLTLSAAIQEGMKCHLVLGERSPNAYQADGNGNILLFRLLGAEKIHVIPPGADMSEKMQEVAAELQRQGRKPYIIPMGGSNELGGLGYAACAQEILEQSFAEGIALDAVVTPSASAGTHAGLLVGFSHSQIPVIGINVMQEKADQEKLVFKLANQIAAKLKLPVIEQQDIYCFDQYLGDGYALPTPEMVEAVKLAAKLEGLLLDPVYTGKTMAGLIDLISKNFFHDKQNVVFIHTGGAPALYANCGLFQ